MARITAYVLLEGETVKEVRGGPPTIWNNITGFHLLPEAEQEKHGWHHLQAAVPEFDPTTHAEEDVKITYSKRKGFKVERPLRKLTKEEIAQQVAGDNAHMRSQRQMAFAAEADPIAFKVLRGEATQEEYVAKVQEIRHRFPYREDPLI